MSVLPAANPALIGVAPWSRVDALSQPFDRRSPNSIADSAVAGRFVRSRASWPIRQIGRRISVCRHRGRHGPAVLGMCRRVLNNNHDAEDAFQATFLVLARQAKSIRNTASVGCWLHGVAFRVASKLKGRVAKQPRPQTWPIWPPMPATK